MRSWWTWRDETHWGEHNSYPPLFYKDLQAGILIQDIGYAHDQKRRGKLKINQQKPFYWAKMFLFVKKISIISWVNRKKHIWLLESSAQAWSKRQAGASSKFFFKESAAERLQDFTSLALGSQKNCQPFGNGLECFFLIVIFFKFIREVNMSRLPFSLFLVTFYGMILPKFKHASPTITKKEWPEKYFKRRLSYSCGKKTKHHFCPHICVFFCVQKFLGDFVVFFSGKGLGPLPRCSSWWKCSHRSRGRPNKCGGP